MNNKEFIKENYKKMSNVEISKKLNIPIWEVSKLTKELNLTRREYLNEEDLKPGEYFIDIPNYSKYQISNLSRVRRKKDNVLIKESYAKDGYVLIKMVNDYGKRKTLRLNRLVCELFNPIDKDISKLEANHIDGNKDNNLPNNLEWLTPSENQKHSYRNGLRKPVHIRKYNKEKIIEVFDLFHNSNLNNLEISEVVDIPYNYIKKLRYDKSLWKELR